MRRIVIPATRLQAEIERARPGVLVQLARPDLEALVQRAAAAREALKNPPRLVKASYTAVLEGHALVGGGQWSISHAGPSVAVVPLGGLNLALSKVKSADGGAAVLADLNPDGPGLLVERAGDQSFFFDWSLRGAVVPNGLKFNIQVPPSPVSAFELKLPADHVVLVSQGEILLTGPHDAENPEKRTWRIQFSGRAQAEILVRRPIEAERMPPLLLAQVQNKQRITPSRVSADFEFNLDILHAVLNELVFECDPSLQPLEVACRNADVQSWEHTAGDPSRLTVRFRGALHGPLQGLRIRCQAPRLPEDTAWHSPWMRLRGRGARDENVKVIVRGENLQIVIDPDVNMERWNAGDFRLTSSTTDANGSQVLSLNNSGEVAGSAQRPSALIRSSGFDLLVRQSTFWQIEPSAMSLQVSSTYELRRGSLFQLALRLPEGIWSVTDVKAEPMEAMRTWSAVGPILLVDLQHGLTPRSPLRLTMQISRKVHWAASAQELSLPDLNPLEATLRRGVYAIGVNSMLKSVLSPNIWQFSSTESDERWPSPPSYSFVWREKPISGQLRVVPQKSTVRARIRLETTLSSSHGNWTARLDLEPVLGSPSHIDLLLSAPIDGNLEWTCEGGGALVRRVERLSFEEILPGLLALGTQHPLERVFQEMFSTRFQRWRLHLQNPLTKGETIFVKARLAPDKGRSSDAEASWDVPIVMIPETGKLDGEVKIWGADLRISKTRSRSLENEPGASAVVDESFAAPYYEVRYEGDRTATPSLRVWTKPLETKGRGQAVFDSAQLTTQLESRTTLLHHLRFDVWNWPGGELPVHLPDTTSKVLAVKLNGKWLQQLPIFPAGEAPLVLPFAASESRQICEIAYATETPSWTLGCRIKDFLPRLPSNAAVVRHVMRLPAGITPLDQSAWQPVFGECNDLRPLEAWQFGNKALESIWPGIANERAEAHSQALLGADAALRRTKDAVATLGDAFRLLSPSFLQNQLIPVIDLEGFRSLEISPQTMLLPAEVKATPGLLSLLQSLDIVILPIPEGILLTSRSRRDVWQKQVETNESLNAALLEARSHGQDGLGRFASLSDWLLMQQCPSASESGRQTENSPLLVGGAPPPGWTDWQQVSGSTTSEISLIAAAPVRILALLLAGVLFAMSWWLRKLLKESWRIRVLALVLCVLGAAVFILPIALRPLAGFPLGASAALVVCWFVGANRRPARMPISQASSNQAVVGSAAIRMITVVLFLGVVLPSARTGEPEPYPIWIVESAGGSQRVFVSPELLKKLSVMEQSGRARADAVLINAAYQGKATGSLAEFTAQYELYSFAEKAVLTVPLANVDLRDGSYLDGAPVYPVAVTKPKNGYQVQLKGKGFHRLTLAFKTRTTIVGETHELTFSGPNLFQNELELGVPGPVRDLHLVKSAGEERLTASQEKTEVRANLGREGLVRAIWRTGDGRTTQSKMESNMEVRETYFWDLRSGSLNLSAALQYDVGKASVDRLTVALPSDLEVRSVEAGAPLGGVSPIGVSPIGANEPVLRTWRLAPKDGARTLTIELAAPATGRFTIALGLIPCFSPAGSNLLLRLPTPLEGKQVEGFLAYRLEGADAAEKASNLGLTSLASEFFAKQWSAAGQREIGPVTRAFSFRRSGAGAALALAIAPARPQATLEARWIIGPSYADLSADFAIVSSNEDLSLVELTIPPALTVAEIRGTQVHHWSRQEAVTQIWLRQPRKEATLHVSGWAKLSQPATTGGSGQFTVPMLGVQKTRLGASIVKVSETTGIRVAVERLRSMTRLSGSKVTLAFTAQAPDSEVTLVARQSTATPTVRALSTVEQRGKTCEFACKLHLQDFDGNRTPLTLRIREFAGENVVLHAPAGAVTHYMRHGDEHSWAIAIPPDAPQPVVIRVQGRFVADRSRQWTMPRLALEGAQMTGSFVGLVGQDLRSVTVEELTPIAEPATELPGSLLPSVHAGAAASFWRTSGAKSRLVFAMSEKDPPAQVLLSDQVAFLAETARWVYQSHLLIFSRGDGSFTFTLPKRTKLLALAIDGSIVSPALIGPNRYNIALDGFRKARRVDVRWQYLDGEENVERPKLERLSVPGENSRPTDVRLVLPFGCALRGEQLKPVDHESSAIFEYAKATVRLSRLLSTQYSAKKNSIPNDLVQAQAHFAWLKNVAPMVAGFHSSGPQKGVSWAVAWVELSRENAALAKDFGWDSVRVSSERDPTPQWPRCVFSHSAGVSHYLGSYVGDSAATLRVEDLTSRNEGITWRRCQLLALATVVFLIFSFMPYALVLLGRLWPEELVLLGCLGTWMWGPSLIGFGLAALGLAGRLIWSARHLLRVAARYVFTSPAAASVPSKS